MRYGQSLYGAYAYNDSVQGAAGVVDIDAAINSTIRIRDVSCEGQAVVEGTISSTTTCVTGVIGTVTVSASIGSLRVRGISATAQVTFSGEGSSTAICNASATANVSVSGSAFGVAVFASGGSARVNVLASVTTLVSCYAGASADVTIEAAIARTRCKLAAFGNALQIRAAYNEGIKIPSDGAISPESGTLEWLVYTFNATSTAERYLFDGAGVTNRNLIVSITTDNKVKVSYGTGTNTITMTSAVTLPRDGATWIGVGWDNKGVTVHVDAQQVSENSTPPSLQFGTYIYVGCNSSSTNSLDGLLDEFRISSRKRNAIELLASKLIGLPLEWDIDTTYLLHFDGDLAIPEDRQGVWVSPTINASEATDYSTLTVQWYSDTSTNTSVVCNVRTSSDGTNWSAWYTQLNGEIATAPSNPYVQIRFILQELDNAGTPTLGWAVATYTGVPTASTLLTGLSPASCYTFAQLEDHLVVCNGVDTPVKYDGTSTAAITDAPSAQLVCVYRNRMIMAKTLDKQSTIWVSGIQDVDDWTSDDTDEININPSDGDEIMALVPTSMTLLIVKQRTTYFLQGYSPDTFQVSTAGEGGTVSPWGIVWTPYGVFRLDTDGIWITDFRKQELLTRKIQTVWNGLNHRRLNQAALYFYKDKLLAAVPNGNANYNNLLLVYDLAHKGWSVWDTWTPGVFARFQEYGQTIHLFGSSLSGNVYSIVENITTDDGTAITGTIETKHLPLISEEFVKRYKWVDIYFSNSGNTVGTARVRFVVDGIYADVVELNVPAGTASKPFRVYPPAYGNTIGVNVQLTGQVVLQGMSITYFPRTPRPERVL